MNGMSFGAKKKWLLAHYDVIAKWLSPIERAVALQKAGIYSDKLDPRCLVKNTEALWEAVQQIRQDNLEKEIKEISFAPMPL